MNPRPLVSTLARLWHAKSGTIRRTVDPDRHRMSKADKKAARRARTAARVHPARAAVVGSIRG